MTINEKIKELEEKQAEISKEIEGLRMKKQTNYVRQRAENYETYFFLDSEGDVAREWETDNNIDDWRYFLGNYFKTKEQAEIYKQNLITYQQLKDIALRLNGIHLIDWNDEDEKKYFIFFHHENNELGLGHEELFQNIMQVYCLDENFLQVALKEIGEEKLKQLLRWGV